VAGAVALTLGFFIAAVSTSLWVFYGAMLLLGLGYALGGNVPAIYLLAAWFPTNSARIIGLYLMFGAFGATVGPPVVEAVVSSSGSWRMHWQLMGWSAVAVGLFCLAFVRDIDPRSAGPADGAPADAASPPSGAEGEGWNNRDAIFTSQFMLVAAAMTVTMACVTTNSSVTISHLVKMGATPSFGAVILSALALTATLAKGLTGRLCESMPPSQLLAGGLVAQALGNVLLASADSTALQYAAALAYGLGWGASFVAANVVLLRYFGRDTGSHVLAVVWLLTTVAAAGPLAAGAIADARGSFSLIFYIYAVLLIAVALPTFLMRAPVRRKASEAARQSDAHPIAS
jgi:MFS family permease